MQLCKSYTHEDDSSELLYLILARRRDEVVLSAEVDKRSEQSDMEHERRTHSVQKGGEAFVALARALDPRLYRLSICLLLPRVVQS